MQIHGAFNFPHFNLDSLSRAGTKRNQDAPAGTATDGPHFSPVPVERAAAPDVARFTEQLRDLPEVRAERMESIVRRIADGTYLTREAAEQTAAALLDGQEGPFPAPRS